MTLRRLATQGVIAELTWQAAAGNGQVSQATIAAYHAADQELREDVRTLWSHAWLADYAVPEFLQDTGLSRFLPVKPQQ